MGRPRKNPLEINEELDYRNLYLESSGQVEVLQRDLEIANRSLNNMQHDYDDALAKNQDLMSRLHQLEARLEALEVDDEVVEDADGMVRVNLSPEGAEIKTIVGINGSVRTIRSLCLNGVNHEYECGQYVSMPADHARILGVL